MTIRKRLLPIALAALGLGLLLGCAPSATPTPTPAPPLTVQDGLGRPVRLAAPPQRIVIAGKAGLLIADAVYAFPQARGRVVALSRRSQTAAALRFLGLLDPRLEEKRLLERDVSAEHIAALHPDVVLMKGFLAPKLGAAVEALGIAVYYVQMERAATYPREFRDLGVLLGEPQRGAALAAYYRQKIAQVQARTAHAEGQPKVLFLQHTAKGGVTAYKVPPASWLQADMVRLAGGQPVWAQGQAANWQVVSLEQIAAWQPDQIYIADYFADPAQAVAAFQADPIARRLAAVQAGQVYPFPKDFLSWDQPDPRWILGLLWLSAHIHPQASPSIAMDEEVGAFYQQVYGLDEAAWRALLSGGKP